MVGSLEFTGFPLFFSFADLITATAFQEKLKSAVESYTGKKTEEAVFETILVPLAKEYGVSQIYHVYFY